MKSRRAVGRQDEPPRFDDTLERHLFDTPTALDEMRRRAAVGTDMGQDRVPPAMAAGAQR